MHTAVSECWDMEMPPYEWEPGIENEICSLEMSALLSDCVQTAYRLFNENPENDDAIDPQFQSNYSERKLSATLFTALLRNECNFGDLGFSLRAESQKSSARCYVYNDYVHLDFFRNWRNRPQFMCDRCNMNAPGSEGRRYGIIEMKEGRRTVGISLIIPTPEGKLNTRYVIARVNI